MHILEITVVTTVLAAIAGWCYRAGGSGKFNTKVRDMGVAACVVAWFAASGFLSWELLLVFGLQFGSETTYFKKKGRDAVWWNWVLVGFVTSLAVLPAVIHYGHWVGFGLRVFAQTFLVATWSMMFGDVEWEEGGRGAWQILTLPLLLIQ